MDYSKEQRHEVFKKLPEQLQDAILSIENAELLTEIGNKYKLLIDKRGELGDETGLVMLGLVPPSDFVAHLQKRLEVDRSTAIAIATDVNDKIFLAIREYLKNYKNPAEVTLEPSTQSEPVKDEVPEAVRRAMEYEQSKLPKESQEDLLHAIENPHTIPLDSAHTWFPPMATHKGLPELAPENDLAIKEGETVHENKQEKAQEPAEVLHTIPITKISTPGAAPVTEQHSPSVTPPTPQNRGSIIDKKLGGVVSLSKEETEENAKQPPRIDPYREPLI